MTAMATPFEAARYPKPLVADTDEQFLALLRDIRIWSGRTAGKVAAYAGPELPRSTAYRFVSPANTSLPKDGKQVALFLRGCRLPADQIEQVVQLWEALAAREPQASATTRLPATREVLDAELVEMVSHDLARRGGTDVEPRESLAAVLRQALQEDGEAAGRYRDLLHALQNNGHVSNDLHVHGSVHVTTYNTSSTTNGTAESAPPTPIADLDLPRIAHGRRIPSDHADAPKANNGRRSSVLIQILSDQHRFRNTVLLLTMLTVMGLVVPLAGREWSFLSVSICIGVVAVVGMAIALVASGEWRELLDRRDRRSRRRNR
jgi:hypothetical protein